MIEQLPQNSPNVLGFKLSGRLHDQDYAKFVPVIDTAIQSCGEIRLLAQFHDFQGWDMHALWDDIRFSATHCRQVEQIALIGDRAWERWMTGVCKPFTKATIRYFDISELDTAQAWLAEACNLSTEKSAQSVASQ